MLLIAMAECYLVRCTAAVGRALRGVYASRLTSTGMVATWKQERAARYESLDAATGVACRLSNKFTGTVWEAEPIGGTFEH